MSETHVWYRSPVYKGRGYSLFIKHTSATLASRIQGSGALTSFDELPTVSIRILRLINSSMLDGIITRVKEELKVIWEETPIPTYTELEYYNCTNQQIKDKIKSIAGDKKSSDIAYYTRSCMSGNEYDFFGAFSKAVTYNLLCITPHIRENPPLNEALHQGRVSGKQIMLPINPYDDIRVKTINGTELKDLEKMNVLEYGTLSVYKTVTSLGVLHNFFSLHEKVPGQKSLHGYDIELGNYLHAGNAVYRDTWRVMAIQLEGITRLVATHFRTIKLNANGKPKERAKRPRKIKNEDFINLQSVIRAEVRKSILARIKVKVPKPFTITLSRECDTLLWYGKNVFHQDREEGLKLGTLYFWNMLKKSQKKRVLQKIRNNTQFSYDILPNLIAWEKSEDEHIKKIYTDIVLPASKLKQGREDVQSTSSSDANAKVAESSTGPDNRQTVGVKLRTASGYEGFCSGEPPAQEAGGDPDQDN
jgi:hypothetical protein